MYIFQFLEKQIKLARKDNYGEQCLFRINVQILILQAVFMQKTNNISP